MSHDKIKAAARARMASTGEPYATARRRVIAEIRAAAAAHEELGPEYSDAVVASFLERVEEPYEFRRQVAATDRAVDIVNRIEGQGILAFAVGRRAQARGDAGRHQDFIAQGIHPHQQRVPPDAVVEDFARDFGDQGSAPPLAWRKG